MKELGNHIKMALIWGVVIIGILCAFVLLSRVKREGKMYETWLVEAQVIKKSTATREVENKGTEKVYLIGCEDKEGVVQTFEITDDSLDGRFDGAGVFHQIRTGKAYQFKVGWKERGIINQAGYYPTIYGAATLSDFPLKEGREITEESSTTEEPTEETAEVAETTKAVETAEVAKVTESDQATEDRETTQSREADASKDMDQKTTSAGLEIGGIKIEVVEETVKKELQESIEEEAKSEAAESFEAEKQALEAEIASLKAQLEESSSN